MQANLLISVKVQAKVYMGEETEASATVYTMVEMTKAHDLNIYAYLKFFLEHRPSADITDEQIEKLASWNEDDKSACGNNSWKENLEM